jgi:hypothetical protein
MKIRSVKEKQTPAEQYKNGKYFLTLIISIYRQDTYTRKARALN